MLSRYFVGICTYVLYSTPDGTITTGLSDRHKFIHVVSASTYLKKLLINISIIFGSNNND